MTVVSSCSIELQIERTGQFEGQQQQMVRRGNWDTQEVESGTKPNNDIGRKKEQLYGASTVDV